MTYSRPGTSEVNALFKPATPNRASGAPDQRVSLGASGPLLDNRSAQQAGLNAGRGLAEVGNFIENFAKVGAPIYKAYQEDRGIDQAKDILANEVFRSGIAAGDPVAKGLYDRANSFGKDLVRRAVGEGMVSSYREALGPALFNDDALTRAKRPEETDEQYRSGIARVRLERSRSVQDRIGISGLPAEFQQDIAADLLQIDQQARGKSFALQTTKNSRLTDSNLSTATVAVVGSSYDAVRQLTAGENLDGASPERRVALVKAQDAQVEVAGQRLKELYSGNNRGPLETATGLWASAQNIAATRGKEEAVSHLAMLESVLQFGDAKGKPLAVNGQVVANMPVQESDGVGLLGRIRELRRQKQDELDAEAPKAVQRGLANIYKEMAAATAASDRPRLIELYQQGIAYLSTQDPATTGPAMAQLGNFFEQANVPVEEAERNRANQMQADFRSGAIDANQLRQRAMGLGDPRLADGLIALSGNVPRDLLMQNRELDRAMEAQDDAAWQRYKADWNKKYRSNQIDASNEDERRKRFYGELRVARANEAERLSSQFDGGRRKPSAEEYSKIYQQASALVMEEKLRGIQAPPPSASPSGQALNDLKIIQRNAQQSGDRRTVSIFNGTNAVRLFKQFNPGKPSNYKSVSDWYVRYLGSLKNPDGGQTFEDPRKTWRESVKIPDTVRRRDGTTGNNPWQFVGTGGLPMGMVDPGRALRSLQSGLAVVGRLFPGEVEGIELPKPTSSAPSAKPSGGGQPKPAAPAPVQTAPRIQAAALSALTGPGIAPSAPQLPAPQGGAPAAAPATGTQVVNAESWERFRQIWGSGSSPIATGARYTPTTPPMPQVDQGKLVASAPLVMTNINHPNAVLIGVNEGTRTATGGFTGAYNGHKDPVRGYNQGNFSAQQGYSSPQQADRKWLGELNRRTMSEFVPALRAVGLKAGTAAYERLLFNLQDLAVQAPLAANGLIAQIPKLVRQGVTVENIAVARAKSFYNPSNGRWEGTRPYSWMLRDQRSRAGTWDYKRRIGG